MSRTYKEAQELVYYMNQTIEKMGGFIIGWHHSSEGTGVTVGVRNDESYNEIVKIMEKLQEMYGGEIQYCEYWECEGFISHSQAILEVDA